MPGSATFNPIVKDKLNFARAGLALIPHIVYASDKGESTALDIFCKIETEIVTQTKKPALKTEARAGYKALAQQAVNAWEHFSLGGNAFSTETADEILADTAFPNQHALNMDLTQAPPTLQHAEGILQNLS